MRAALADGKHAVLPKITDHVADHAERNYWPSIKRIVSYFGRCSILSVEKILKTEQGRLAILLARRAEKFWESCYAYRAMNKSTLKILPLALVSRDPKRTFREFRFHKVTSIRYSEIRLAIGFQLFGTRWAIARTAAASLSYSANKEIIAPPRINCDRIINSVALMRKHIQ